ncbi:MAG: hypothetical protein IT260_05945 [Saprospiraceae bacterium]|nr:hypothetical protein [Saprospiraceae bacterium]
MFGRLSSLLCCGLTLLAVSCENDSPDNRLALTGRWELTKGFRNKRETGTLGGTYFLFREDGKMQTNLPIGPEEPMDFTLSKNEIRQKSTPPVRYQIQNLSDSMLVLSFELRGMQFEMHFRKANAVSPDAPQPVTEQNDSVVPPQAPPPSDTLQE